MDWLLGRLRGAGFPPRLADHAYHALDSHILGFTLWEAGHSVGTEDFDGVGGFEFELDLILDGLRRLRDGTDTGRGGVG